jgi:hypothetical protein
MEEGTAIFSWVFPCVYQVTVKEITIHENAGIRFPPSRYPCSNGSAAHNYNLKRRPGEHCKLHHKVSEDDQTIPRCEPGAFAVIDTSARHVVDNTAEFFAEIVDSSSTLLTCLWGNAGSCVGREPYCPRQMFLFSLLNSSRRCRDSILNWATTVSFCTISSSLFSIVVSFDAMLSNLLTLLPNWVQINKVSTLGRPLCFSHSIKEPPFCHQ